MIETDTLMSMPADYGVQGFCFFKCSFLLGGRFRLINAFPFRERHAVDTFACLIVIEGDVSFPSGSEIPFGKTIPAETSEIHEINILHVGAALQVFYQATKSGGFNFITSLVIHENSRWVFGSRCQVFWAAHASTGLWGSPGHPR